MQLDSPDNKKFGFPMRLDVDNTKEKVSKVIEILGKFQHNYHFFTSREEKARNRILNRDQRC